MRYRLTLEGPEGDFYEAETLPGLIWALLCHRLWHLWHDGRWMD